MIDSKIVYVSGDGTGDFNVDDDNIKSSQTVINKAIQYVKNHSDYTTVCLKGPFTYWINKQIICCNNLELMGKDNAIIKLVNKAGWDAYVPLIGPKATTFKNIKIHDLEIDGNHDGNFDSKVGKKQVAPNVNKGLGYYNHAHFDNSSNIEIYNMYLHDGHGDGLRVKNCTNVKFHDNKVVKLGHEAAFFLRSDNCHSYNNTVAIRTNTGSRMNDCTNSSIHDNTVWAYADYWDAGGPGFQIERQYKSAISVDVYNNVIYNTYGPGIWVARNSAAIAESGKSKVNIYNNKIYGCGINPSIYWVAGILIDGIHNVYFENNVVDGCYGHGVVCMGMKDTATSCVKVSTYVRNNIITNTLKRKYMPEGTGVGIHNRYSSTHKMSVNNNCVYGNVSGNYKNVTSASDINKDPIFTDRSKHDYSLKSNSPCIKAGTGSSNIGLTTATKVADETIVDNTTNTTTTKTIILYPTYSNRLKESSPNNVLNTDTYTDIGELNGTTYRNLIFFRLTDYNNIKIKSAILSMHWYYPSGSKRTNDTVVEIYRPVAYINEQVTWENANKDTKWAKAGGSWYDKSGIINGSVPFTSLTFDNTTVPGNKYYNFDLTELVQKYLDGAWTNTGIFIKAKDEKDNYIAFYSGRIAATNKKMKLTITYE